jgi:hypothetical protein
VLILPLEHHLRIHCWSRLLLDLLSPSSLLLLPPSRSPLPFLIATVALLLDPYVRSPIVALQEPLLDLTGMGAELMGMGAEMSG